MNLGQYGGYWDMMDCADKSKGLTAPSPGLDPSASAGVSDTEPPDAYFQPNHSLSITEGCLH